MEYGIKNAYFRHVNSDILPFIKAIFGQTVQQKCKIYTYKCGPGSVVGIATGYGLDGPGIESRWEGDFPHLSRPALGPTQPPVQ